MRMFTLTALLAALYHYAGHVPAYANDSPMKVEQPATHTNKVVTRGVTANYHVAAAAAKHGVPVKLALAIAHAESRFNCRARNPQSGASGIMQVMPATARGLGIRGSLFDCTTGATAGVMYLRRTLASCGGNWTCAAARYEAGEFSGRRTSQYAQRVMSTAGRPSYD